MFINPLQQMASSIAGTNNLTALANSNANVNYEQFGHLLKLPSHKWITPDIQNYSILGNPYTYYQYKDPEVYRQVKALEDKIGKFENMMPFIGLGAYAATKALRPITKHIPILTTLGSPAMAPLLGLGSAWLMANNAKEDKKRYLANKIREIHGPTGPIEQELTNLHLLTEDPQTQDALPFDDVKRFHGDSLQQSMLRLQQRGLDKGKSIFDISYKLYDKPQGSRIFTKIPNADAYQNIALPSSETDDVTREQLTYVAQGCVFDGNILRTIPSNKNERKASFMKLIIDKAGLKPAQTTGGVRGFITNEKNLEIYRHALNLFKSQNSITNGLFNSINLYIEKQTNGLIARIGQGGVYKAAAVNMFRESVRNNVLQTVLSTFPNYPEITRITESLLAKKWADIERSYRSQLI